MLTNRISVTYDMKNIDDDYDIFKVEKSNKDYYKYNILDSALYEFRAAAVQWTFGAKALVLFRKGEVTEKDFTESIRNEYKDVKIQKIDLFDEEQCRECFYSENRLLAQLLINSIHTPKHAAFMYHNLSGKLLYHDPSWKHKDKLTGKVNLLRFLEIVIDPGMYLNLEHKTFRRCEREHAGLYVIDPKTGEFRKKLKTDINVVTYEAGALPHTHFRVDNFNITDYEHFRKSKMGIMNQFLSDVKVTLSNYISIELVEREDAQEYEISDLEKKGISEREYGELLKKKGVVIVDEIDTERSKEMINLLRLELSNYYGVEATVGTLSSESYNIRIIHNEEFYDEYGLSDPHKDNVKGYIVQHMTEEAKHFTDSKGASPAVKKIVQELIIKGDVRERSISIFDWQRLDAGKDWTFLLRKKHKDSAKKEEKKHFDYYRLQIDRSGNLKFDSYCDADDTVSEEWEKISCEYDSMESKQFGIRNQVEGLLYSDIDNIHAILLTKEKTLPNIEALGDTLKETDVKEKVLKEILLTAMETFVMEHPGSEDCITEWKSKLSEETDMITKGSVKKILNMRKNKTIASLFNRFLHEKYGIWIDGELRKGEFEATYQISNLLNIKYEYDQNEYDGHYMVYYVGAKSKKRSYPNACCMRKVVSAGDSLEYEEMLPLMAVEFVRNSQYTVLPFPFKYLREYMK